MPAKFITAPDKISDSTRKKILIIDANWHDIEAVTLMCMTKNIDIDFYIFAPTSIITDWLDHALKIVDTILLNDNSNRRDLNNNAIMNDSRTKLFGTRNCEYAAPMDFIIETLEKEIA